MTREGLALLCHGDSQIIAKRFGRYDKYSYLCNRVNMFNFKFIAYEKGNNKSF